MDETDVLTYSGRVRRPLTFWFGYSRRDLGVWGEWMALRHLRRLGWDVVARNWTSRRGEIDLIAYDSDCLVFVEVKTRQLPTDLPAEESLDLEKGRRLEDLALEYLWRHEIDDASVRFDLIAIETPDLRLYRLKHHRNCEFEGEE